MNRREVMLTIAASLGGGYALFDLGVLSLPDGTEFPDPSESDVAPKTESTQTGTPRASDDSGFEAADWSATAKLTHDRVNAFRASEGRSELRWSPALADMAQSWGETMRESGEMEHRSGDLIDTASEFGASCGYAGENIAQTWVNESISTDRGETAIYTTAEELADGLCEMWKHSPPHRENMLNLEYTQSGVGVVVADDNSVWAVQNFC